jgi:hypothetical protein
VSLANILSSYITLGSLITYVPSLYAGVFNHVVKFISSGVCICRAVSNCHCVFNPVKCFKVCDGT